jgi:hypothetical protein
MQRQRFFFNLGCLGAAILLVVASVAFGPSAAKWVGLGIGIAGAVLSLWFIATVIHQRSLQGARELRLFGQSVNPWSVLGGGVISVAIWQTVQAAVFEPDVARWLTFANGLLAGTLACTGLIVHENTTERVIHVLEIVERPERQAD